MKKIITVGLICLLVISLATAIVLTSKEELLTYFNTYKSNREQQIKDTILTIKYTTDKYCRIEYNTEEIYCEVCFEYIVLNETYNGCSSLPEGSTEKEDDETVKNQIEEYINLIIPIEEIKYKERDMKDKIISIESREAIISNQYYCSTKPSRTETCVCLSVTKRTCYYETCGSSPYGRCTLGEWIKVTI